MPCQWIFDESLNQWVIQPGTDHTCPDGSDCPTPTGSGNPGDTTTTKCPGDDQ